MIPSNRNSMLIWIELRSSWGIVNCDCWQDGVKKLSEVGIVLEKCFWKGTDLNRREADVSLKLHHLSLKTLRSPPGDIYWILLRRKCEFRYWSNTKGGIFILWKPPRTKSAQIQIWSNLHLWTFIGKLVKCKGWRLKLSRTIFLFVHYYHSAVFAQ